MEGVKALSEALKMHTTMKWLWLGGEMIKINIRNSETIRRYYFGLGNKIGDEGVKVLCEALKVNTGLIELELQSQDYCCTECERTVNRNSG